METRARELFAKRNNKVSIRVMPGHFVTQHSHINYCIDMTRVKTEMNAARSAAKLFAVSFRHIAVDTIFTLDHTKLLGAFVASELAASSGVNMNQEIAVISPEFTNDDKLILRDNLVPYVQGKRVLVLCATATTGMTAMSTIRGIRYYMGDPVGVGTVFGGKFEIPGVPVLRLVGVEDLPDYRSYSQGECPLCRDNVRIDALVNAYGYSKI